MIKSRINSQHEDISSHLLLSIFKIAEVDVVYPAPPSSAIATHRPSQEIYIIIVLLTLIYNFKYCVSFYTFLILKNILKCLSTLFDTKTKVNHSPISLDVVPFIEKRYFINENDNFVSILMSYEEFIECNIVEVNDIEHDALALGYAQNEHITENVVDLSALNVTNDKETKHIVKAVSITILNNYNDLVANAIITKYFSRYVYYEIEYNISQCDPMMLFYDLRFENIASSSYGIVKSVSLGLTLAVV